MNYRITGLTFDERSNDRDYLIKKILNKRGVFVLWQWNGKQWKREETFTECSLNGLTKSYFCVIL